MLSGRDRDRLLKVLGLLASDQGGERAAAGAAAARMLRDRGLTWPDLIQPTLPAPSYQPNHATGRPASPTVPASSYMGAFNYLLARSEHLNVWQREFVRSAYCRSRLTEKQVAVLLDMLERVKRLEARS